MPAAEHFLGDLAVVVMTGGAVALLFHRLRLPIVAGYLLAGLIVGPHLTPQLVSDPETVELLSELGVIFLMFTVGLEFRLRSLAKTASTAGVVALVELPVMIAMGYVAGQALGWTPLASLYAGVAMAISSTMIVVRTFKEQAVGGALRELVIGTLIFEDLAAMLLLALLTALASGGEVTGPTMGQLLAKLGIVLAMFLGFGMLVVPRMVRRIAGLRHDEMLVVGAVGLCFGLAWLAHLSGFSVALGAFLAGALAGESGLGKVLEEKVQPLRDIFSAVFFVAIGMQLEPELLVDHVGLVVGFTLLVLLGKTMAVTAGGFLAGAGNRVSIQAGLSMAQIGEFSFILAGVGIQLRAVPALLPTLAVAVSVLTAFLSPLLIRRSEAIALWVDRRLPHSVQTFSTLYASWVESLRLAPREDSPWRRVRRGFLWLLVDALAILALVVVGARLRAPLAGFATRIGLPPGLVGWAELGVVAAALVPFLFGIVRVSGRVSRQLATMAIPLPERGVDNGRAPRRALGAALQLALVLLVGLPLVLATHPFMPGHAGAVLFFIALVALAVAFWRSANDLLGHMQAGAELVVATLAKESHRETGQFQVVRKILPGLGDFEPVHVAPGSFAAGRTLGEVNLRGRTGATIVAILRGQTRIVTPPAHERLEPGDFVALTGSHEAIAMARPLLEGESPVPVETPRRSAFFPRS
jgi:CPA2 family monovalent cation:H+ antiporter-2